MTVANPVQAFAATLLAATPIAGSSSTTVTVNMTAGWEIYFPVRTVQAANVSAGPEIRCYRSMDGGATFANVPMPSFGIVRAASGDNIISCRLDTGMYAIQLMSGGPNTTTFIVSTQMIITSIVSA